LRESLEHAGRDLNIIGALIMPCSDEWMQEHKPGDLLLSLDTRHAMLREDGRLPVGIRVPRTPNSRLTATWRDLVSFKYMAAASDVRVRLIQLLSTETSLELDERIQPWPEQCDGTIVSMYGRQSPENLSIQSLEQDPWTKLHEKGDVVRRYQRMIANDKGAIKGFLRVITRGPHEKTSLISSTSIRKMRRGSGGEPSKQANVPLKTVSKLKKTWRRLSRRLGSWRSEIHTKIDTSHHIVYPSPCASF
jgi:hypothetical protein